jgi:hypothetical protein
MLGRATAIVMMVLPLCGCAGIRQGLALDAAAADHNCPRNRVSLVRETTTPTQHRERRWRYELLVCSQRRVYQYDPELEVYREVSYVGQSASTSGDSEARFREFRRQQQAREQREERLAARREAEQTRLSMAEDEFTGEVSAQLRTGVDWEDGERVVPTLFSLVLNPETRTGELSVTTVFRSWRWRNCHSFHMLADGERVSLDEPEHQGETRTDGGQEYVSETVTVPADSDAVRMLAEAESIRGRICEDVFSLREDAHEGLRQLWSQVSEGDEPLGVSEAADDPAESDPEPRQE